jgi:hypothetical protein
LSECAADPRAPRPMVRGEVGCWYEVGGAGNKVPLEAYRFEGTRGPVA